MSTTEERYARATRSSHLELKSESAGDVETIIAAGLAETMGVLLTRLRVEWDSAQGNVSQYRRAQVEWLRLAREAQARARECTQTAERAKSQLQKATPEDRADLEKLISEQEKWAKGAAADGERFQREAIRESSTAKWEILQGLRSLEPAKQALYFFASRQAPHKACNAAPEALGKLIGRVLDVWLDRVCHECNGVGFMGGFGKARVMCRSPKLGGCGGSGSRRAETLSDDASEQAFGLWLINVMDSRCNVSMGQVRRKTRNT